METPRSSHCWHGKNEFISVSLLPSRSRYHQTLESGRPTRFGFPSKGEIYTYIPVCGHNYFFDFSLSAHMAEEPAAHRASFSELRAFIIMLDIVSKLSIYQNIEL